MRVNQKEFNLLMKTLFKLREKALVGKLSINSTKNRAKVLEELE